jgi:nucleoside-diphosphate-sugar epimerase
MLWGQRVEIVEQDLARVDGDVEPCVGIDIVYHLAGHAHADDEGSDRADELHRSVTVAGTSWLLANAAAHGVRRFVFLSSVKAIGESTGPSAESGDVPRPTTAYGRARREAELLVLAADQHPMGVVLRSPLVYGPGVKGNLKAMIEAISAGRFPPIPIVDNRRSMVDVRDVVAALRFLETTDIATQRVFLVTDGEAYSTRRIYEAMSHALGRPVPRWSIPLPLLRLAAHAGDVFSNVTGRAAPLSTERLAKLFGNAHYSNRSLVDLGFHPTHRLEAALPEIAVAWRECSEP